MTQAPHTPNTVRSHAIMLSAAGPRRSQPQVSFRLDSNTAEQFREWLDRETIQKQAVLETLVKALIAGELPDVRTLRLEQRRGRAQEPIPPE